VRTIISGCMAALLLALAACVLTNGDPEANAQDAPVQLDEAPPATAETTSAQLQEEVGADSPAQSDLMTRGLALRQQGVAEATSGEFDQAAQTLKEALALLPDDVVTHEALDILEDYQAKLAESEAQRASEYAAAVERVRWAIMVQDALPELSASEECQKLRQTVDELIEAYGQVAVVSNLMGATVEDAEVAKVESVKALTAIGEIVAKLGELLSGMDGPYAQAFVEAKEELSRQLTNYRDEWASADMSETQGIEKAVRYLGDSEQLLAEAIGDVKMMVEEEPWRLALVQAALAKKLAAPSDRIEQQQWYIDLIKQAEARGRDLKDQAEWEDALIVYSGLEMIDSDNSDYKQIAKVVGKHVRVLRYYGKPTDDEDASLSDNPLGPAKPLWEQLVEGIDVDMVRTIISRVDSYYVVAADYRKLIDEALTSIRVLAETPQAADSFDSLADDDLRNEFLDSISDTEQHFAQKDGPLDYLDLLLALNRVLEASERTVNIPSSVLAMEFADGLLGGLDTFSAAIWPNEVEQFRKLTKGNFTGVGIQVAKNPGEALRVITPMADTPAFRAGIKMGDLIIAVDGAETTQMPIDAIIDRIVGKKGTTVVLRIERKGVAKPFDVAIVRDTINILTIKGWRLGDNGKWDFLIDPENKIGYIRVERFTEQTDKDLDQALKELNKLGARSIILDFRLNPGGLLRQATRMTNEFVPGGQIVMTQGRQVRRSRSDADAGGDFTVGDLIVLVDEYTASASEIVSGALKDLGRATVIGERSFGKGSVQQVLNVSPPPNQALLKLTAAYYYVGPSEKLVHRQEGASDWGVDPDIEVRMTPQQLRRWLDVRQRTDLIQDVSATTLERDLDAQLDADLQLTTALTILRLKRLSELGQQVAADLQTGDASQ